MKYKILGKTGIEVSVLGIGGIPIQHSNVEEAVNILSFAKENGVNFLDTARGYTVSEEIWGAALKDVGRNNFHIATKSMARTYDAISNDFNTSMKNLGIEYLDLYQFHNVSKESDFEILMSDKGAYKFVSEMKRKGYIGHIGVSSHSKDMLEKFVEMDLFETVQFPYNAVEHQGKNAFSRANKNGIGVILMKPLAGGAIKKHGLALRYALSNPDVSVAIPGIGSLQELKSNVESVNLGFELSAEELAEIKAEADELGNDFCRRCGYCAPCTVGIDIPSQFLMEGYYSRYDLKDWAKDRYAAMKKNAADCIRCGACEPRCPYELKIMDKLEKVAELLG